MKKKVTPVYLIFFALVLIGAFLFLRSPKRQAQILPFPNTGYRQPTVSKPPTKPSVVNTAASYFSWPFDFPRTNISEDDKILNVVTGDFA